MNSRHKTAHGYESMMLVVLLVVVFGTIVSIFLPAIHYGHIEVVDNIRRLFENLSTT